ncbi:MAG: DUF655 domain-containing protein [Thermoprotei archaeon]
MSEHGRRKYERHEAVVYVLDYMRTGNQMDRHPFHKTRPVAQVLGDTYFMLLEISPLDPSLDLKPEDRIDLRTAPVKVDAVISYEDLTSLARDELPKVIEKIILNNEKLFVEFFNQAQSLTLKLHVLELIPGVGKKTLRQILDERKKKPFESFKDLEERGGLKAPVKMLTERILKELQSTDEKYFVFVYPEEQRVRKMPEKPVYLGYLEKLKAHEARSALPSRETVGQ